MALVVAKKVDEKSYISVQKLIESYPRFCTNDTKVLVHINRIFNKELEVVNTPRIIEKLPVIIISDAFAKLDLSTVVAKYGVPKGYYIELIVSNIILKGHMIPVFPNEIIIDCDYNVENIIKREIESIRKDSEAYEAIGKLYHINLPNIASDLQEGIVRFNNGDIDGSIKFFRKVIEAFKSLINENNVGSSNRAEALKKYLSKTYHLLSNFGEHAGTSALIDEGILAKEITISITNYIARKLEQLKSLNP